jgi:CRP-like cAMP-binding protein
MSNQLSPRSEAKRMPKKKVDPIVKVRLVCNDAVCRYPYQNTLDYYPPPVYVCAQELIMALKVAPGSRSIEELDTIYDFLIARSFEVFDGLAEVVLRELCSVVKYEFFHKDVMLFNQGDEGDKMYVILRGAVRVWIKYKMSDSDYSSNLLYKQVNGKMMKKVAQITHSDRKASFGEMALIKSTTRNAGIDTAENCDFLTISKEEFELSLKTKVEGELYAKVDQLKTFEMFHGVEDSHLQNVGFYFNDAYFNKREHMLRQGDAPKCVYFIVSGKCEVSYMDPDTKETFRLSVVSTGQVIGDVSVVRAEKKQMVTVTALSECFCLRVGVSSIKKSFRGEIYHLFVSYGKLKESLYSERIKKLVETSARLYPALPSVPVVQRPLHKIAAEKFNKPPKKIRELLVSYRTQYDQRHKKEVSKQKAQSARVRCRRPNFYTRSSRTHMDVVEDLYRDTIRQRGGQDLEAALTGPPPPPPQRESRDDSVSRWSHVPVNYELVRIRKTNNMAPFRKVSRHGHVSLDHDNKTKAQAFRFSEGWNEPPPNSEEIKQKLAEEAYNDRFFTSSNFSTTTSVSPMPPSQAASFSDSENAQAAFSSSPSPSPSPSPSFTSSSLEGALDAPDGPARSTRRPTLHPLSPAASTSNTDRAASGPSSFSFFSLSTPLSDSDESSDAAVQRNGEELDYWGQRTRGKVPSHQEEVVVKETRSWNTWVNDIQHTRASREARVKDLQQSNKKYAQIRKMQTVLRNKEDKDKVFTRLTNHRKGMLRQFRNKMAVTEQEFNPAPPKGHPKKTAEEYQRFWKVQS